jgi:F-box and WD-40 domain protein CDC4
MQEEHEVFSGKGWRMLKRQGGSKETHIVGLAEAVERYGKKRSYNSDIRDGRY